MMTRLAKSERRGVMMNVLPWCGEINYLEQGLDRLCPRNDFMSLEDIQ